MNEIHKLIENLEKQLASYVHENDFRMKLYRELEETILVTKTTLAQLKELVK